MAPRISRAQIKSPVTASSSLQAEISASRVSRPSRAGAPSFDFGFERRGPVLAAPSTPRMTGVHTVILAAGGRASRALSRFMGDCDRAGETPQPIENCEGPWQSPEEGAITVEHKFDSYSIRWKKSEPDLRQEK